MTTNADILVRAKEIIKDQGWAQGWSISGGGKLCLGNAVQQAANELVQGLTLHDVKMEVFSLVADEIARLRGASPLPSVPAIVTFNDDPSTTLADVNKVLDRAIRDAEDDE